MVASHPLFSALPPTEASRSLAKRYFVPSPSEEHLFHPHPTGDIVIRTTTIGLGVGTLVSAIQNALQKHDKGAMGIFTRTGGTIAYFAGIGAAFSATSSVTANIRQTDDALNAVAGGCAAGFLTGIKAGSLPVAVGSCAFMGTVLGTYFAAGGRLTGTYKTGLSRAEREAERATWFKQDPSLKEAANAPVPA